MENIKSDSDSDDLLDGWSLRKRKKLSNKCGTNKNKDESSIDTCEKLAVQSEKFEELKAKSAEILVKTTLCRQRTELRRSRKIIRKVLKDPEIKAAVEGHTIDDCCENNRKDSVKWQEVKPYLTVHDHLQGPVLHRDCGPKTELECMIEDSIKNGDFEKAELLSDTLADREFAVKIDKAFKAKRRSEELEKEKIVERKKQMNKIRWTFDAKERWQMKGNM